MRLLRLLTTALGILSVLTGAARADDVKSAKKQFPLEGTFINHAVGPPFDGSILEIVHPGFSLGTEYVWKEGRWGALVQGLRAGYYHNKYDSRAFFLLSSIGYRFTLGFGLFAEAAPALGYIRLYHPTDIWRLNAQGEYEKAKDKGKSDLMLSTEIGLGFDFKRKWGWPLVAFLRYQFFIHLSDTPAPDTHWLAMLQAGVKVFIW
ncbi:MAG: hypothetical protein FJY80_11895 [Candidatus Aminicenantes bacterium]|nr:hypothetical protein [Candidatus Aminicenantes bacterium]